MSDRSCGECTICCWFFAVPETGKPTSQWCQHCTEQGCAVHQTRPQSCRNFQCFWLMEPDFPEDMRPDRCGVVVSFNEEHTSVVIHVDPERPDSLAEEPGSWWMEPLLNAYDPVCVVCGDDRMVVRRVIDDPAVVGREIDDPAVVGREFDDPAVVGREIQDS